MRCFRDTVTTVGLLDFGIVRAGSSPAGVVRETIARAVRADALGFSRLWLTEHHAHGCAWGDPCPVLSLLGDATSRLRIGLGGALLSVHGAARVASSVNLLAWLYPNRIDLGIARASTAPILPPERGGLSAPGRPGMAHPPLVDPFETAMDELLALTSGSSPSTFPPRLAPIPPAPARPAPQRFALGSSTTSARLAGARGLPFVASAFHRNATVAEGVAQYRASVPTTDLPQLGIAFAGICASTSTAAARIDHHRGPSGFVTPSVVGTTDDVTAYLEALITQYAPDFVLFLDLADDPICRMETVELLGSLLADGG